MLLKFDDIITDKPITDKSRPKNAGLYLSIAKDKFRYRDFRIQASIPKWVSVFLDLNRGEVLNARPDSSFTL